MYPTPTGKEAGGWFPRKRLMLLDGDSLSFTGAITEAGEALGGINHLEGLVLSAWKSLGGRHRQPKV